MNTGEVIGLLGIQTGLTANLMSTALEAQGVSPTQHKLESVARGCVLGGLAIFTCSWLYPQLKKEFWG